MYLLANTLRVLVFPSTHGASVTDTTLPAAVTTLDLIPTQRMETNGILRGGPVSGGGDLTEDFDQVLELGPFTTKTACVQTEKNAKKDQCRAEGAVRP